MTLGAELTTFTDPTSGSTLDLPAALPTSIAVGGATSGVFTIAP